ncbi:MAG: glycosyltransferase family 39 protein [Candidatus Shapirobacteria bacterium]|jgi:hypothetical protein
MSKNLKPILVLALLALGTFVRLYKITNPVADWHSHRQADTASVTHNFLENGINFFVPIYHDLSNVQSGIDNPKGYRMVEAPIYNIASIFVHRIIQIFDKNITIDRSSRLTSVLFSEISALLIFFICQKYTGNFFASILSMAVFLFLPFNIYYSRSILPENTAITLMLLSIWTFDKSIILSGFFISLSILCKPFTALISFPTLLYLSYQKYRHTINLKSLLSLLLFGVIALIPFYFWRRWIAQFPEGIPVNAWLFNDNPTPFLPEWYKGYNLTFFNKLVAFRPFWFKWLFFERINKLILGSFGLIPLFLGFAYKKNHSQKITLSLVLGILLYFIIVAQGNIQHDYYQALIIPSISIIVGFGYFYMANFVFKNKTIAWFSILIVYLFSFYFSWDQVKTYYKINNSAIVAAGDKIRELTPKNALVVAPYNGDTAFLYQTKRSGWPTEIYNLDELKLRHGDNPFYLVSVSFDKYTTDFAAQYKTVYKNDQFIILNLN